MIDVVDGEELTFSERFACPEHGVSLPELQPRIFSFNSPHGACPRCTGPRRAAGDRPRPARPRPVALDRRGRARAVVGRQLELLRVGDPGDRRPLGDRPRQALAGPDRRAAGPLPVRHQGRADLRPVPQPDGPAALVHAQLRGDRPEPRSGATARPTRRSSASGSRSTCRFRPCPACNGARLKPEVLAVTVGGLNIHEFTKMSVTRSLALPRRARADRGRAADRRADRQGDPRAADLPRRRRRRLPEPRPRVGDALGRRGAAPPAGDADRLAARRRALHPRRAVDRAAPARQRPADRRRSSGCATSATRSSSSSTTSR